MKKIILSAFLLIFFYNSEAQLRLGFVGSPNFSWLSSPKAIVDGNGMTLGFSFGAMGEYGIRGSENYLVAFGLNYASLGGKLRFAGNTYNVGGTPVPSVDAVDYDYRINYIEIPAALKLRGDINGLQCYGALGLQPSFRVKSVAKVSGTPFDDDKVFVNEVDYNRYDGSLFKDNTGFMKLSLIIGAGVEMPLSGNTALLLGLKYDNGFTSVLKDDKVKTQNKYLALQVGIFF